MALSYYWAAGWQKGPYDKIWKFENDAYYEKFYPWRAILENSNDLSWKIKKLHAFKVVKWTSFLNVMKHHDVI